MPHDIIMPALGMAQETGKIISWLKQPGDAVTAGDVIMEVETDKSVMEVEAQASGFLTRVTAKAGDDVPVGKVVAVIAETPDVSEDDPAPAADKPSTGLSASVRKTSRAIVIDEGHQNFGITGEIASRISDKAFYHLDAPVQRMGAMDVPVPFSPALEDLTVPTPSAVAERARKLLRRELFHAA